MKKVVFLQNKANVVGGVLYVNKIIGEELSKNDYSIYILSIRKEQCDSNVSYDKKINCEVINAVTPWEIPHSVDVKRKIKDKKILSAIATIFKILKGKVILWFDYQKCKKRLNKINPDYIVVSHYEILDAVPKKLLKKTIYEQHSSFEYAKNGEKNYKYFFKYNNKIRFLWLSESSKKEAIKSGINNNYCIYNPSRINTKSVSNVTENKTLVTIARLSKQKRIDLMIEICEEIFKDKKFKDWSLKIYGNGELYNYLSSIIKNKKQIKLMGLIDNPKDALISSSINLNTSDMEGYSMSIVEAEALGIPTITFNFGESVYEQIRNNKDGFIIENDDKKEYISKLKLLMTDEKKLKEFSIESKKSYEKNNKPSDVVKQWIKLFNEIDGD